MLTPCLEAKLAVLQGRAYVIDSKNKDRVLKSVEVFNPPAAGLRVRLWGYIAVFMASLC